MEIRFALKRQYHAGLAMLRECIELATDDVWHAGTQPRNIWRIAYHAVGYTHLYLGQRVEDFAPWEKHREEVRSLWGSPAIEEAYSKAETLAYIELVDKMIDKVIDSLDLECETTGFPWYEDMGKLEHQILNIRHLQTHVGQLSEILIEKGVSGEFWKSRG